VTVVADGGPTLSLRQRISGKGDALLVPIVILVIGVLLTLTSPYFFTATNISNILLQSVILGIVAFGSTFVVLGGELDLSISSGVALVSVIAATVMNQTGSIPIGLAAGLATGVVLGVVNGILVTKLQMPSFIATFATLIICHGIALDITDGGTVFGLPNGVAALANTTFIGLRLLIWWMVVVFLVLLYLERRTVFGVQVLAVGGNREASRLSGIPVDRVYIWTFIISGVTVGIAGLALTARVQSGQPNAEQLLNLEAVAAIVVGGTSLFGGRGSVVKTLWGVLLLMLINNGMDLQGIDPDWKEIATGLVLIAALSFDFVRRRLAAKRAAGELKEGAASTAQVGEPHQGRARSETHERE
jgi:ribose transport system permease protein